MDENTMAFRVYRPAGGEERMEMSLRLLLLFVLEGNLRIRCQEERYSLHSEDVLLLNPGMRDEVISAREAIVAECTYTMPFLTGVLENRDISPSGYREYMRKNAAAKEEERRRDDNEIRAELEKKGYAEPRQEKRRELSIDLQKAHATVLKKTGAW